MKTIFFIFCIINIFSCKEYILKAGIKSEGYCQGNNLVFQYDNCYFVNDQVPNFENEFELLIEDDSIAKCKISQLNYISSDFEILCKIENYSGCKYGDQEIPKLIMKEPDYILLENNDVLYFDGFSSGLYLLSDEKNILISSGDLFKGACNKNVYEFMINGLTINASLSAFDQLELNLTLKHPQNLNATCILGIYKRSITKLNVNCKIVRQSMIDCLRDLGNEDLIIKNASLDNKKGDDGNTYIFSFEKFENLSTIIEVKAGRLKKNEEENKIDIFFENSIINYDLKKYNISFVMYYKFNAHETNNVKCLLIGKDKNINCEIPSNEKMINFTIINNPLDNYEVDNKTIRFYEFEDKKIYDIIAGPIQKGYCDDTKAYKFNFTNSIIPFDYEDIAFKMKEPNFYTFCSAKSSISTIECEITKSGKDCPFDEDQDLIVGSEDPSLFEYNENITLYFSNFSNKQTLTIYGKKIIYKYIQDNYFYFFMNYTYSSKGTLQNKIFDLTFNEGNYENIANCIFQNTYINCSCNKEMLKNGSNSDIIISKNPDAIVLNKTVSLNFRKFESLKTYTIVAGKIDLGKCVDTKYQFKIFNIRSITKLPKNFNLVIKEGDNNKATCEVKDIEALYALNCEMEGCSYNNINLTNNEIESDTEILYPSTFFYNGFNKRTVSIRGGIIKKGTCTYLDSGNYQYKYNILNNNIDNADLDKIINFIIYTSFDSEDLKTISTNCEINLSGEDNTAYCTLNLDKCPNSGDDIYISQNITGDYTSDSICSFFYFDFDNKNTTTIKTTDNSIIIKGNDNFIITDNVVNTNFPLDESSEISIDIKVSNVEKKVKCNMPEIENNQPFNITCDISNEYYNLEDEIEIIADPEFSDNKYYFYGYKNKRTLSLNAGNLIRENINNNFKIKDNIFNDEIEYEGDKKLFSFIVKIDDSKNSNCSFNISEIESNNKININCLVLDESYDLKNISILENPTQFRLNNNITLYFSNFDKLKLSALTLGKINKKGYEESKKYLFYFNNTKISRIIEGMKNIILPIFINDIENQANCSLEDYSQEQFNMRCVINDIEMEIIDISYRPNDGYYNIFNSKETLFIENREVDSKTLIAGYIEKQECENNIYEFSIKNNILSGTSIDISNGIFELTLEQFSQKANCKIETEQLINCTLDIDETKEEEINYCKNIYEDIKVKEITEDYILINGEILHFYGFDKLETYTVQSGEIFAGKCRDSIYEFYINNSKTYKNLSNTDYKIEFNLNLSNPEVKNIICNIPIDATKNKLFNIKCMKELENCEAIFYNNELIIESNPPNIEYNNKNINFKGFKDDSSLINFTAGNIGLSEDEKGYILKFYNSSIDHKLNNDLKFNLSIMINNDAKEVKCTLYLGKTILIECPIGNIDLDDFNITITNNPEKKNDEITGKIIIFEQFINKKIKMNTLKAGYISKGYCLDNIYHFSFNKNSFVELYHEFKLEMKKPYIDATCENIRNNNDIICTIEGIDECPVDKNNEIIVGDKDPEGVIIENTNDILKFANFKKQNTYNYNFKVGNLIKEGKQSDCLYYYSFSKYDINSGGVDYFFENNLLINIPIYFNNILFNSVINMTTEEGSFSDFKFYFNLSENTYCNKDENELKKYDLRFDNNIDGEKNASNCFRGINLIGFNNKQTITAEAEHIIDKYILNEELNFILSVKETELDHLKREVFNFNIINISDSDKELLVSCQINDENNIKCIDTSKSLTLYDDIEIKNIHNYIIINNTNYTYYFAEFNNLRTYSIRANNLQKRNKEGNNYYFNILNCVSPYIPKLSNIYLNIYINETLERTAECTLQNLTNYAMECLISNEEYNPFDIIFKENTIKMNTSIFSPNTVFFYDFDGKRTLTLKAGLLNRGKCNILPDNKMVYKFNITNNEYNYNINNIIPFNLNLISDNIEKTSLCSIDFSKGGNVINCSLNDYCPEFFKIENNPNDDYSTLPNITLTYEDFTNKEILSIKMNEEGKIIKIGFRDNYYDFIITNNTIKGTSLINEEIIFSLNINEPNIFSNCIIANNINKENFNLTCSIESSFSFSKNDEIIILEDPNDSRFYFSGYKDKRTLSLEAGSIFKNNGAPKKFDIIDNHFMGDTSSYTEEITISLNVNYNDDITAEISCSFNMKDVQNNYVNISCSLPDNINEIKYVSILSNPEPKKIDTYTTLNYFNFTGLNLNTINLGNLVKNDCIQNNYIFYFLNTIISSKLNENISLNVSTNINNEEHISKCEIIKGQTLFNMECKIENFCPNDNYDIGYEIKNNIYNYNNSQIIYIENNKNSTTTLKAGYIQKDSCDNNYYNFSIKDNALTGNTEININGEFNIKLKEFTNDAICQITTYSNIIINCRVKYYSVSEKDYCSNMKKDINIETVRYNGYHYITINDNLLHLYSFDNLGIYTIEAGDLIRGGCNSNNIYYFKLKDCLIYNNLNNEQKINFNLMLSQPKELNAVCTLPTNLILNNQFEINCEISNSISLCPIDSSDDEKIKIKSEPGDIMNHKINFKNFINKTSLVSINAGRISKLSYDSGTKKYIFVLDNTIISSSINKNINFDLSVELGSYYLDAKCILDYQSLRIKCELENIDSERINIVLVNNPTDDVESFPEKVVSFFNFHNKQINSLIAGKLQKGNCENNVYSFIIKDSYIQNYFNNEFYLQLKEPNKLATCIIINFDEDSKKGDLKCSFEETNNCQSQYKGKELIIGEKEPEFIRINENEVVYFYNFINQTTIVYKIEVDNILKIRIDKGESKYYFNFGDKSYKLPNFKENILFQFNMAFNNSEVTANCLLIKMNDNDIENSTVILNCYFPLSEEWNKRDDLLNYDLSIGSDINNKKIVNTSTEIILIGFDNKETLTLLGNNIVNKYKENNKINFVIDYKSSKDISNNIKYNITFNKNEENNDYNANCTFNIDTKKIKCEDSDNKLTIDNDIKIKSMPDYIFLNKQTFYFNNFQNKRTYTIKAGLIEKLKCDNEDSYTFNIIKTSSKSIPQETNIEIPITINDNQKKQAICTIKNSNEYNMICVINGVNCPKNIILSNIQIEPNETLFYPNTLFFNDFNNKRTIAIKAGTIKKSKFASSKYSFTFEQSEIDYKSNSLINFNLMTLIDKIEYTSNCYMNISGIDNTIYCEANANPDNDDDLLIQFNPNSDYRTLYPNSIFFENFVTKNTTTIIKSNSGLIIKEQNGFVITNNYVKENDIIYTSFNVKMKIKINEQEKEAICSIPKVKENEIFNITCQISYSQNVDIEIIEEPVNDNYYFYGYKNKKTLTLTAGSIYKEGINTNKFDIINNKFSGNRPLINKYEFYLRTKYNNEIEEDTLCSFNTNEVSTDSSIAINCTISNYEDIKTISILSNPNYALLNENTTLYFNNFNNLNLYTLTPGDIIKGNCNSNSFSFSLINTIISNSLSKQISLNIPLIINDNIEKESTCQINKETTNFNMSCVINNYCPNNFNIDIKIETIEKSDINIISPNTLYINIPSEKQTSTLNLGYLEKSSCSNLNYGFGILDSVYSGKILDMREGQFKLKLNQFNNEADCYLNSPSIQCNVLLNNNEEEYCSNLYKDIKAEKFIGDNNNDNYIIINNNILHFYGAENLETFTIVAGELNQGTYNNKKYSFSFNNTISYNDISSSSNLEFTLKVLKPIDVNANCLLPNKITKENKFDINCEINGDINNYIIQTDINEPINLKYNTQNISFHEFINKNTQVNLTAGKLRLGKSGNNNYYLNFTNSNIDYTLTSDISFDIPISINEIDKNILCYLYTNKKYIQCDIGNYANADIKHIYISTEPSDNINSVQGKTLKFNNFKNKEINTLIAGYIEKGQCDIDNINYTIYFRNCESQMNNLDLEFALPMSLPETSAECDIINTNPSRSLYDVFCSIKGPNSCAVVNSSNTDFTVGSNEPEEYILSASNILYYFNFSGQSTIDTRNKYIFKGGILSKGSVKKSDGKVLYSFNIEDCSLNKPFDTDYTFYINISLDIYEDNTNKNYKGQKIQCIIPKSISDINKTNIITKCSFNIDDTSFYKEEGNYDILIQGGNQIIEVDEETKVYISSLNDLTTVTMYGCQINKGQCDNNNKYTYTFDSCIIPKEITFQQDLEFSLKTNKEENSICTVNNNKIINCIINDYSICSSNNDIIIGNNEAQINYTKYSLYKNFYIIGLKNLYTATLNGGAINFGKCDSNDFIYTFANTKLTNTLSQDLSFILAINAPIQTNSLCKIPSKTSTFNLECVIKGESQCPISDPTLLKIEEITTEKKLDLIKPNSLYINNFINKNIIELKADIISEGQCNNNKYEFYFIESEIIGEIKGEIQTDAIFTLNLKYPTDFIAYCIIPKNIESNSKFNLDCYIEGNNYCPIFNYTFIQTGENNPDVNESLISPNVVKFSGFENKKLEFNNYYLEIQSINWNCLEESYDFNLTSKFKANVTEDEEFKINVTINNEQDIKYNCSFSNGIIAGKDASIICSIINKEALSDDNLVLNFDIIYLEEKNKYIINQAQNKKYTKNNVQCPFFYINTSTTISPTINSTDNAMQYSFTIQSSYTNKEIKIYDKNKQSKNNLQIKLKPATSTITFIRFLLLEADSEFNTTCEVPKYTTANIQINCKGSGITDTTSEYFQTQSDDIIEIEERQFSLDSTKLKNPYKKNEDKSATDSNNDDKKDSISTAGKVILIILIILVFAAIVLALIYYFCFYRKNTKESIVESGNDENKSNNNNNPENENENSNNNNSNSNQKSQSSESQNSGNSSQSRKRNIKSKDEAKFDY